MCQNTEFINYTLTWGNYFCLKEYLKLLTAAGLRYGEFKQKE